MAPASLPAPEPVLTLRKPTGPAGAGRPASASITFIPNPDRLMITMRASATAIGLALGVALGFAGAFGGFLAFLLVLVLAAVGGLIGAVIEGRITINDYVGGRANGRNQR